MRAGERKVQSSDDFYTDLAVGEILRRARVQRGISIYDAAQGLYIRQDYLEALERSDFDALPGRVYVIGFIRTYAEFLDLDGARVVSLLKRQSQGLGTPQSLNIHMVPTDKRLPGVPVMASAFAAILIVLILWIAYQDSRIGRTGNRIEDPAMAQERISLPDDFESLAESTKTPDLSAPTRTPSEPVVPKKQSPPVRIVLIEESWIELRNPEGRVVEARVFRKGETFDIGTPVDEFDHAYAMTMGNSAGVRIEVEGRALPPLGGVNKVRRNVSLDPKTLKALVPE